MKSTSLVVAVLLLAVGLATGQMTNKGWWKNGVFYQVYPRSLMDADNDGTGDLEGIRRSIPHFVDLGLTGIWLSPIYKSPMVDFGYDISDFVGIDPVFGTMADFENLVKDAKKNKLKVILDLVPNHTSDQHKWFQESVKNNEMFKDFYIWRDCENNGVNMTKAPNNWLSVFNGTAWTYNAERKQCYYHQFYPAQPDLNYKNLSVQSEMKNVMKFWLNKGVDGFRIDAVPHLIENNITTDEPKANVSNGRPGDFITLDHILTKDQPETYEIIQSWRDFVDNYANETKSDEKLLMTEAYTSWEKTIKYYNYGANVPFNFKFITDADAHSNATKFKNIIDRWIEMTPKNGVPNWVMGNHDRTRIGTRYPNRADQMVMLEMILPGVAVTYYGEEIGMVDDTEVHKFDFRDGCRTPFQWNDTLNAGFSMNETTWLPVNANYKELNLKKQKADSRSDYKIYTTLINLRKSDVLRNGKTRTDVLNQNTLAVTRENSDDSVTLLMNFQSEPSKLNLMGKMKGAQAKILVASKSSNLAAGATVDLTSVNVPAKSSIVLMSGASVIRYSFFTLLLAMFSSLRRFYRP